MVATNPVRVIEKGQCAAVAGSPWIESQWHGASLGTHCRYLPPFAGADFAR
jgi:hypothetical protein